MHLTLPFVSMTEKTMSSIKDPGNLIISHDIDVFMLEGTCPNYCPFPQET